MGIDNHTVHNGKSYGTVTDNVVNNGGVSGDDNRVRVNLFPLTYRALSLSQHTRRVGCLTSVCVCVVGILGRVRGFTHRLKRCRALCLP